MSEGKHITVRVLLRSAEATPATEATRAALEGVLVELFETAGVCLHVPGQDGVTLEYRVEHVAVTGR